VSADASLDPRLNAFRADLADQRLAGKISAPRYAAGCERRVEVGRAPVRHEPGGDARIDTYYHYGDPVRVFARDAGYAWCQSLVDGYVGYLADGQLAAPAAPTHFVATLGSYAYEEPDLRAGAVDFLPRHSRVCVAESDLVTRGTRYAQLDTGGFVPFACLSAEPPSSADIVSAARLYLGCPYLWAGRSFLGIDCSGLVQSALQDLGVAALRDTDMQRDTIGAAAPARNTDDLCRGDLLYMPGHVLIYAGAGSVIHADGGSMMVREEPLAAFMQRTGVAFDGFAVRHRPA
jgi:cell wall-associated NlpC family hydrolase